MSDVFQLKRGGLPLLVSVPHSGESLGPFAEKMTAAARRIADTDWHLPRLYDFLDDMDVTVLTANHSRYVIDLNRDPSGKSLYPGQNVTELCPTTTFAGEPIYREGYAPAGIEVAARVDTYWRPYHAALKAELERLRHMHGYALLWDAHSIGSVVPRFFDGRLPDFNLGSNDGKSCGLEVVTRAMNAAKGKAYTSVLDGRFKGGYITRTYGNPARGVHALQLELSQITYMDEAYPFGYKPDIAADTARKIAHMITEILAYKPER